MFLTIPVSVAYGERSLFKLKPIKKKSDINKKSNKFNNKYRLNSLAIMLTESEDTRKIDFETVLEALAHIWCMCPYLVM